MERVHASAIVDLDEVDALLISGHLAAAVHTELGYRILNYTTRTVIDRRWTDTTERCRGLVLDSGGFVVSRPIRKFHNYTSVRPPGFVQTKPPLVYDKLDGSLGIVVPVPTGGHIVATRGSFESDQARHATDVWARRYGSVQPPRSTTLLVEIVYPANRIVVANGDFDDLVLLAAIDHQTGADVPLWEIDWPGPVATLHPGLDLDDAYRFATGPAKAESEGIVLVWTRPGRESYRLKVKHPDYIRRHSAIFGLSAVAVWRRLVAGDDVVSILADLPDEVHGWTATVVERLLDEHRGWVARFESEVAAIPAELSRAQQARLVKRLEHPGPVFRLLDGSDVNDYVWKLVRPSYEPYRTEAADL